MTDKKYGTTKEILMNARPESIARDSWSVTKNFEGPAVINNRTGHVLGAYDAGAKDKRPPVLQQKESPIRKIGPKPEQEAQPEIKPRVEDSSKIPEQTNTVEDPVKSDGGDSSDVSKRLNMNLTEEPPPPAISSPPQVVQPPSPADKSSSLAAPTVTQAPETPVTQAPTKQALPDDSTDSYDDSFNDSSPPSSGSTHYTPKHRYRPHMQAMNNLGTMFLTPGIV
jgi:hypothetical protein